MNIRYDASVDAAYISFLSESEAAVFSFTYACDPSEVGGQIHLDFDISGRLTGIEVLQASKKLPDSLLKEIWTTRRFAYPHKIVRLNLSFSRGPIGRAKILLSPNIQFSLHVLARARTLAGEVVGCAWLRAAARWPRLRPSFDGLRAFRVFAPRDEAKNRVLPVRTKNGCR